MKDLVRSTVLFVIKSIYDHIPSNCLKRIYAVGSLATDEARIIHDKRAAKSRISDLDIVIDVSIAMYLRCLLCGFADKLSRILGGLLRSRGLSTHVSIVITSFRLFRLIPFIKPNTVYLYELVEIIPDSDGYSLSAPSKRYARPSGIDSLNLVFSSIADYIFAKREYSPGLPAREQCYIIAKRCLTILYSMMLFEGIPARSYASRTALARRHFDILRDVLSASDLDVLETLTLYKLSGCSSPLSQKLPLNRRTMPCTLDFLNRFFRKLAMNVLEYELTNYVSDGREEKSRARPENLATLMEKYRLTSRITSARCLARFTSCSILGFIRADRKRVRAELYSLLVKGMRMDDLIRYLVGKSFLPSAYGMSSAELERVKALESLWKAFMV